MQTVTVSDLQNNLPAYLEQVLRGEELLVEDRSRPIARLMPLVGGDDLDEEEIKLARAGLLRLPLQAKTDDFFSLPAPDVPLNDILSALQAVRDED
mgnify:CR=1 FL=1